MIPLIVVGSGGHARVVLDAAITADTYDPVGFVDDTRPVGTIVDDFPVLGATSQLDQLLPKHRGAQVIIAVGDNFVRASLAAKIEALVGAVQWATVIDASAVVGRRVQVGPGTVINAGSIVNPSVKIGRHVIFNNTTSVAHDNVFGDFSSTGPGVTTGGNVHVGAFTHIGIGATVSHGIIVGEHTVIGAGSMVIRDTAPQVVVKGVPGKVVRDRAIGERYL
jgi:sugar O-acyltransferase (sialic acid O-acetyltransferase NeuD family)